MIASSFTGMIMALPLVFTLSSSASRVNGYQAQPAVQNQSTAQVSDADFAKFAFAYDKGYQARTANVSTATVTTPGTCTDTSAPSVGTESGGSGAYMPVAPAAMRTEHKAPVGMHAPLASVVNSYNSYVSTINNSSSVSNTNSNNTAGSNNMTMTSINAHELKGMVTIDNSPTTTQVAAVDSFNKDSYNTKTDTKIQDSYNTKTDTKIEDSYNTTTNTTAVSDSFNKQVAIDSGNTSTETNNTVNDVTKTIDSNNTTNVTKDSNNTTNTSNTLDVTNTETKTIDSNNTNVDVTLGNGQQGGPHNS